MELIIGTLQHELVHLDNILKDIRDCSDDYYHNKKFKIRAEKAELVCEKSEKFGYGITLPSPELKKYIEEEIRPNPSKFEYYREKEIVIPVKPPEKRIFKYICPQCNLEAKGKKDIHIICGSCIRELIEEGTDD